MNLQDFVCNTITEIINGVKQARSILGKDNGQVCPSNMRDNTSEFTQSKILRTGNGEYVYIIDFDVAVYADKGKATEGGIGVSTGFLNLGSRGRSNTSDSSLSRIKFQVPVVFPKEEK